MISKKYITAGAVGALLTTILGAGAVTFAQTNTTATTGTTPAQHQLGVGGRVTAVSGNTVTVTGKDGKTYTIDATSAAITKDMTVGVADIKVGDTLMADGTVNGTTVTATSIHDGKMPMGGFGRGPGGPGMGMGRGVHGTVASISGNTLTVTATNPKDSTTSTYTVDASSATVLKGTGPTKPATSSLSAVAVGDNVMIEGTISGTNVVAKMVVDGPIPKWDGKKPTTTQ